jgi:hypothetical protein
MAPKGTLRKTMGLLIDAIQKRKRAREQAPGHKGIGKERKGEGRGEPRALAVGVTRRDGPQGYA